MIKFKELKNIIKQKRKPLFIETKDGIKVAVILSDRAKEYYRKKGFVALTLKDIQKIVETSETFEEAKERIELVIKTADMFKGIVK